MISLGGIIGVIWTLNIIAALFTVFREKRDIAATWAWLLVLSFLPLVGFILYAFFGRQLSHRQLAKFTTTPDATLTRVLTQQRQLHPAYSPTDTHTQAAVKHMLGMFLNTANAPVTVHNPVQLFTSGRALFDDIIATANQAQHSIYIEFYTFAADALGKEMRDVLIARAKAGVAVYVLYDAWGSMGTRPEFFAELRAAGGHAEPFLGIHSNLVDFRLNFRNHRKIVTIDGTTSYIGGFNIGDQYVDQSAKFGHWRDTHLRILGEASLSLQHRFVTDWNTTVPETPLTADLTPLAHATTIGEETAIQLVASGPNTNLEQIKLGYLQLINLARQKLYIQTPYLIPDQSVLDALRSAIRAGVDVRIMVPHMPDHAFVYRATQYYAHLLAEEGAKIYFYQDGFIHAKTITVDDALASVGSANLDFRSLQLNFEANAFIYNVDLAKQLAAIFEADIADSTLVTAADFRQMSLWLRFKQAFSRLLSPIL